MVESLAVRQFWIWRHRGRVAGLYPGATRFSEVEQKLATMRHSKVRRCLRRATPTLKYRFR